MSKGRPVLFIGRGDYNSVNITMAMFEPHWSLQWSQIHNVSQHDINSLLLKSLSQMRLFSFNVALGPQGPPGLNKWFWDGDN